MREENRAAIYSFRTIVYRFSDDFSFPRGHSPGQRIDEQGDDDDRDDDAAEVDGGDLVDL